MQFFTHKIDIPDESSVLENAEKVTTELSLALQKSKVDLVNNNNAKVDLAHPEDGISPGQACVFYRKDQFGHKVLGGGWIKE